MVEENLFTSKEKLLAAIEPLLEKESEYIRTGVMDRARGIFYLPSCRLYERKLNFEMTGDQRVKDEACTIERQIEELSGKHPVEWQAWQVHDKATSLIIEALDRGVIKPGDLKNILKIFK